jgi:hypothetical protein
MAMFTTPSLQHRPGGLDDGCVDFPVFAKQKPKAQKWHGGRISFRLFTTV